MEFTKQDLDVLFEAVERWEQDDASGEIMGLMFESMVSSKMSPEEKAKIDKEREERNQKRKLLQKQRKERGVVLRAKLIMLKDKIDAESFIKSV